jgi:hypothetical protein
MRENAIVVRAKEVHQLIRCAAPAWRCAQIVITMRAESLIERK